MQNTQEPSWNVEQITDEEIYAAIRYLDPGPGSANKQLEQLTDTEMYAAIRYLDPDRGSVKEHDHFAAIVICVGLVLLVLLCLEFVWFYQ
jgi:hypothetical protein